MSEFSTDEQATEADEVTNPDGSPNWLRAREQIKRQRAEAEELQVMLEREREERRQVEAARAARDEQIGDLRAELTFVRAGIDTSGGAGALFARIYDGPMTPDDVQASYAQYLSEARAAAAQFAEHVIRTTPNGEQSSHA